jgi:hypothetical protein
MSNRVLNSAADLYGQNLEHAGRLQLRAIISAIGLEIECRHCNADVPDGLADLIKESGDEALYTLLIAAAARLRLPTRATDAAPIALAA